MKFNLSNFFLMEFALGILPKNSSPNPRSPRTYIVLAIMFKSMINLELNVVYGMK